MLFNNYWERKNLAPKLILEEFTEVAGFDGHKSRPRGRATLIVSVMGKHQDVYFLLMNCRSPYNGILGRDWTVPIEVNASARYQCTKFPRKDRVAKIRSNQLVAHQCNEAAFGEHPLSEVRDMTILSLTNK